MIYTNNIIYSPQITFLYVWEGNILQSLPYPYMGNYTINYPHLTECSALTSDGVASGPRGFPSNINLILDI